ncbi:MAG: dTMP kinase [Dehalococcoidia bacterium]
MPERQPGPAGGLFVAFEGGEGAGKSTQVELVARHARAAGFEVVTCREPGGTPFGEAIRDALLHGSPTAPIAELLAFNAARAELVQAVIRPALERGALVLSDRFCASTVAYQQFGRGLDAALVAGVNEMASGNVIPALQVLLNLTVAEGLGRRGGPTDRFEAEERVFHERVRAGFLAQAEAAPERWLVLDATRSPEALALDAWAAIAALLTSR